MPQAERSLPGGRGQGSLHRTAFGQLEHGERVARADTLVKFAGSLGVRPEELLGGLAWTPGSMTVGHFGGDGTCS